MLLHHPVGHMLVIGKAAKKMINPFLSQAQDLAVDGVLHCNYKQTGTVSGRFSSSEPNLQNIPVEGERFSHWTEEEADEAEELTGYAFSPHIKRIFLVRPGYVHIHMDKQQAEMYALGHYSKDTHLISLLREGSVHDGICRLLFGEVTKGLKQRGKALTFGYQYGCGLLTTAKKIKGSIHEARALRNRYGHIFPKLPEWRSALENQITDRGYVQTDHGRRHYLRKDEAYMTVNRICQGHIADELKGCMVRIGEWLDTWQVFDTRILLNIHDELVIECPEKHLPILGPKLFELMTQSDIKHEVPIPCEMEITRTTWSDIHKVENPYDPATYWQPAKHAAAAV